MARKGFAARAVHLATGRDDPDFVEAMIEDDERVVKADATIRQFQVVDSFSWQVWLDKILEVVSPVTEATTERKRQVDFFEQLIARHQAVEDAPWIAELLVQTVARAKLATRTGGAKREERFCGDERIARLGRVEEGAAQEYEPRFAADDFD